MVMRVNSTTKVKMEKKRLQMSFNFSLCREADKRLGYIVGYRLLSFIFSSLFCFSLLQEVGGVGGGCVCACRVGKEETQN